MSFYKRFLFHSRVFVTFFLSLSLAAGASQSTAGGRRKDVVPPLHVKVAAPIPAPVVQIFGPSEHFSLECWKAFNEQLQVSLLGASLDPAQKILLASVAPGECSGCEDKTWERVKKSRVFLDTSKDTGVVEGQVDKIRDFFAAQTAIDVKRVLVISRSLERDLFAKSQSSGGFDLNTHGWIVVVVNDAPHVQTSFPGLQNCIVVPSLKTLEAGDVSLEITIGEVNFPSTLFTIKKASVERCGGVLVAKLLAAQVAAAVALFKLPQVIAEPADA